MGPVSAGWAEIRDTDGNIMSERMHEEVYCYWF